MNNDSNEFQRAFSWCERYGAFQAVLLQIVLIFLDRYHFIGMGTFPVRKYRMKWNHGNLNVYHLKTSSRFRIYWFWDTYRSIFTAIWNIYLQYYSDRQNLQAPDSFSNASDIIKFSDSWQERTRSMLICPPSPEAQIIRNTKAHTRYAWE